jgi:(1->4)-alpha-D-glucan 1-alpha-D-glucosylmutase
VSVERRATYRLQLRPGFGFAEVAGLAPYLARLGVSHVYLSPCLQARSESTHGYDVVDFGKVSAQLGGEEAFDRMCESLAAHSLGIVLDIVPNHMAAAGLENAWWWDVLENGPSSRFAPFFDIDWDAAVSDGRLVIPVLADHYGRALEAGSIQLRREPGRFCVYCGPHAFPAAPRSLPDVLAPAAASCGSELLAFAARALNALPLPTQTDSESVERRHRDKQVLYALLERLFAEEPGTAEAVDAEIARLNADLDRLDAFVSQQNFRPAFWRIAARELGYRRFFDVDTLIALRVEDPQVFAASHARVLGWLREGRIDGVRVDHVDGLRDPEEYLRRLRAERADGWLLVEKILAPDEALPASWPIDGTTGYEFLDLACGVLVDPDGCKPLAELWESFTRSAQDYADILSASKRLALDELLGSDLRRLGRILAEACRRHRRHRDYTGQELEDALREVVVALPVYRTYVRKPGEVSRADLQTLADAVAAAARSHPDLPPELFEFVGDILAMRFTGPAECELALRFQQLSGAAMAKGAEDTAFYRHLRLLARNEVGSSPAIFDIPPERFHAACAEAQGRHPHRLLATATHDTKRGEDVRARLAVLSELPDAWAAAVERWSARLESLPAGGLERGAQYLLYQTLVGAWPLDPERAWAYMLKAVREQKLHTSWRRPDPAYEAAVRAFTEGALADAEFCADLEAFCAGLRPAAQVNGLAQTLLKLTAPGVPDLYQGGELWDLSLVDPDNRRPVDFALRQQALAALEGASPEQVLERSAEGWPKLWLIQRALALRSRRPDAFGRQGSYEPLAAQGACSRHVIAFARGASAIAVVPRLLVRLGGDWRDTRLELPAGTWSSALTGEPVGGGMALAELLARFPVALLESEAAA